jgi:hypothetical protein
MYLIQMANSDAILLGLEIPGFPIPKYYFYPRRQFFKILCKRQGRLKRKDMSESVL